MNVCDFFIVGAPKCGTTSLYRYLQQHPNIFMSPEKEPEHYCSDLTDLLKVTGQKEYAKLFGKAPTGAKRGEASTWYLYSRDAIPNILSENPDARFVAMVRNPVDMLVSYHNQMIFGQHTREASIERSWRNQTPPGQLPTRLRYGEICKLGEQIDRMFRIVPEEQRLVITFDEFSSSPKDVYKQVLGFLNLDAEHMLEFERYNERRKYRNEWIAQIVRNPLLTPLKRSLKSALGRVSGDPAKSVGRLLYEPVARTVLEPAFRHELQDYFAADVKLLGQLLNRDLSAWTTDLAESAQPV